MLTATVFVLDYVRANMFVKGHVENWVNITDIDKVAINKFPKDFMKKCGAVLSDNFRSCLGMSCIVNATKF